MTRVNLKSAPAVLVLALLSACGGSSDSASDRSDPAAGGTQALGGAIMSGDSEPTAGGASTSPAPAGTTAAPAGTVATTPQAAARLLAQASFGPTAASINEVVAAGPSGWINSQFTLASASNRSYLTQLAPSLTASATRMTQSQVFESIWKQAVTGRDQLRQRTAYALSQIFVISALDSNIADHPYGLASYYDMLEHYAFGNFRDLLQAVALHPMMGIYLSHLRNQKEDAVRLPDENFAREIMQLMTIGLYQLNQDGSHKLVNGEPIETYRHEDVMGLAKVFTGWSWAGPDTSKYRFSGIQADPSRDWTPMQQYAAFHSTSEKRFLGVTISGTTNGEADLKVALDTLFHHPNVGPFIGRQLIQRMVTSNPSPAYVARVAAAFANNGGGVRGDMKAVLRAILLDPEASRSSGKLREPVLRLTNWMRAFNTTSASGRFLITSLEDPLNGIGQNPLRSPSVFNFYRPTYSPPNSSLSAAGMVAPELQITSEPSVTGWLNFMHDAVVYGVGTNREVKANYSAELALATQPALLLDRVNLLLLNGNMSSALRNQLLTALNGVTIPVATGSNAIQVATAKQNRVYLAVFLALASPEYLVQK